jgi:hypothetical protein
LAGFRLGIRFKLNQGEQRMRSRRSVRIAAIGAAALATGFVGQMAFAGGNGGPTPANKAVAAGDTVVVFGPQAETTLLTATMRTSKPTDLILQTSLECSILTKLQTGPIAGGENDNPPKKSTAHAEARILGWLEIDDDDQNNEAIEIGADERVVPIGSTSQPPQNGSQDDEFAKVTFCDRTYERTVEDGEDPLDGIDRETDYIDTKTANAFNWVLLNAGSGIHHVRLVADLVSGPSGPTSTCTRNTNATSAGSACTQAYVGNRTLVIEPTKMANDAVVGPSGS